MRPHTVAVLFITSFLILFLPVLASPVFAFENHNPVKTVHSMESWIGIQQVFTTQTRGFSGDVFADSKWYQDEGVKIAAGLEWRYNREPGHYWDRIRTGFLLAHAEMKIIQTKPSYLRQNPEYNVAYSSFLYYRIWVRRTAEIGGGLGLEFEGDENHAAILPAVLLIKRLGPFFGSTGLNDPNHFGSGYPQAFHLSLGAQLNHFALETGGVAIKFSRHEQNNEVGVFAKFDLINVLTCNFSFSVTKFSNYGGAAYVRIGKTL